LTAASKALESLSQRQEAAPDISEPARQQTRLRLASVLRQLGDFRGAMGQFELVLKAQPNLLNVQVEAAQTFQEGAAYRYAIKGGRPDPTSQRNVIWGWERISAIVARQMRLGDQQKSQYSDTFFEARLQVATCRLREAQALNGEKRTRYLQQARQAVTSIAALYPDLGGNDWRKKYDDLLRQIQPELGESPSGLGPTSNTTHGENSE
ncbi:MAG TPA: hypothetical protein VIY86_10600, partial [Pirellulaceae bacterium]